MRAAYGLGQNQDVFELIGKRFRRQLCAGIPWTQLGLTFGGALTNQIQHLAKMMERVLRRRGLAERNRSPGGCFQSSHSEGHDVKSDPPYRQIQAPMMKGEAVIGVFDGLS